MRKNLGLIKDETPVPTQADITETATPTVPPVTDTPTPTPKPEYENISNNEPGHHEYNPHFFHQCIKKSSVTNTGIPYLPWLMQSERAKTALPAPIEKHMTGVPAVFQVSFVR